MLHEFLALHRDELIERFKSRAAFRHAPAGDHEPALPGGVPRVVGQLIEARRAEHAAAMRRKFPARCRTGAGKTRQSDEAVSRNGLERLQNPCPVEEIVYGYGELRQVIMDLAVEHNETIRMPEFQALNGCLDKAVADTLISHFTRAHAPAAAEDAAQGLLERFGFLAHELRNHLQTAANVLAAGRIGNAGSDEATAAMLDSSMSAMRKLVDRSLADVRSIAEQPARRQMIALADFIAETRLYASLEAKARECAFIVEPVDTSLGICADKDLLHSALSNLLQNAFKFTGRHTQVALKAFAAGDRVRIAVEDNCGGWPEGTAEQMFRPFAQNGHDRCGVGLGLSICRRSVHANGGILGFRNIPGKGCVFTIDLPRQVVTKQREERSSQSWPAELTGV